MGARTGGHRCRPPFAAPDHADPGRIATADADLSDTEIVVAELLTNALAHTTGPAWVSLRWNGLHPLLSVADLGPGFATAYTPDRPRR